MDTHGFQCPYYILERALLPDHINTCIDMAERGAASLSHVDACKFLVATFGRQSSFKKVLGSPVCAMPPPGV
jgi:hypothetical protein